MIRFARRMLRRTFSSPHTGEVVAVVDGTGYEVGIQLCDALAAHGLRATSVEAFDIAIPATCLVLLLPARPRRLLDATHHVFSVVGAVGSDPDLAVSLRQRIVLTWYVPFEARARMAVPRGSPDGSRSAEAWNCAELMLGDSWQRELSHHHGDPRIAVECRSRHIARMMHSSTHRNLVGKLVPDLCRNLSLLDPYFLHTLSVQVADYRDDGTHYRWVGATSISMAIRIRSMSIELDPSL